MNETVKKLQEQIKKIWDKYDKKQRTIMISVALAVVVTVIILAYILTKPTYVELVTCEDTVEAASVRDTLVSNSIDYSTSSDGLVISVKKTDQVNATYLIAQEGITASEYTVENALSGGFSTTSDDKEKLYQKALEEKMRKVIESFDYVNSASITFNMPTSKLSIINSDEETFVSAVLDLKADMPSGAAESMAKYMATAVGNETTNSVTIIDTRGKMLYKGDTEAATTTSGVSLSAQNLIKEAYNNEVVNNITKLLSTTQIYTTVSVSPALSIDFSKTDTVDTEYRNPDEVLDSSYDYESTGGSTSGGVPGTDSNGDDTTYEIQTSSDGTNTVTINKRDYAVSSKITHIEGEVGKLDRTTSTVAVIATQYKVYNEDTLRAAGELDNVTWDEYKAANAGSTEITVSDTLKAAISTAINFSQDNISILAYEVPVFEASTVTSKGIQDYLPIILAVIILGLLGFVVWRSLRPVEVSESEPEISVESLLSSTKESQEPLEDIDMSMGSEAKKAIDKFVEENPESVALLLRNWLNDDWN